MVFHRFYWVQVIIVDFIKSIDFELNVHIITFLFALNCLIYEFKVMQMLVENLSLINFVNQSIQLYFPYHQEL